MTLYIGNKKIADTGVHGVYYGSQAIKSIYYGSQLVYQYITYAPGQILLETGTVGTHTITPIVNCTVSLILVSGGGGGANNGGRRTGGQGALITGQTTIYKNTTYTITVGKGGNSVDIGNGVTGGGCTGETGGSSTALGNTCTGGTGAHSHTGWWATNMYNGSPGSGTTASAEFTLKTGTASTAGIYGSYGAGGYDINATGGYCKISVVSVVK